MTGELSIQQFLTVTWFLLQRTLPSVQGSKHSMFVDGIVLVYQRAPVEEQPVQAAGYQWNLRAQCQVLSGVNVNRSARQGKLVS